MRQAMMIMGVLLSLSATVLAQNLKVEKITQIEDTGTNIEFPTDLNGNKCVLIKVGLKNESVTFEGNVVGTPSHSDGTYFVFLSPNSKYLNIKYPSEEPLMIRFRDYNVTVLPSGSVFRIDINEPSGELTEQLDSHIGEVSAEAEELYERGGALLTQNDYVHAFEYFTKSYELGNPKAAYQLGFIYSDPYHAVRKNPLARGMVDIPDTPVKRDMKKAYAYYLESAEAGFVTAQYAVGECLEKGDGVKKDKKAAMEWYKKAAEQGHLQAKDKIGDKIKKNRTLGIVTSYGSSDNEFILNDIECDVNDLTAVTSGRKDANDQYCALLKVLLPFDNVTVKGDMVGEPLFKTNEYWVYLPQGSKEIEINYPDFEPLKVNFKKAGIDNLIGKNTYKVSISFPIDLLKDDAEMTGEDLYKIGFRYMERRDNQYIRWMTKAADKGNPKAMYQLGACYLYGTGVKKDVEKAVSLLERSSEMGEPESSYYLGQYYELMAKDKKKAQQWYDKAAEQGYEAAKDKKARTRLFGIF